MKRTQRHHLYRRGEVWRATDQERAAFLHGVGVLVLGITFGLWLAYWMVVRT